MRRRRVGSGRLEIRGADKVTPLDLSASAQHVFAERVLRDESGIPMSVARHYYTAQADIKVHENTSQRKLRRERATMVATLAKDGAEVYSPHGPLTREELELTADHLDVLALHSLLPGKEVAIGSEWDAQLLAAQAMAGMDGVTDNQLKCKFTGVQGSVASITVAGTIQGIHRAADLTVVTDATLQFHLVEKRIIRIEWRQKETRAQGPVSPASTIETVTVAQWTHGREAAELSDGVVGQFPAAPVPGHLILEYRDAKGRFQFTYDRSWHLVANTPEATVMRLLDRGQIVAQVNITPWKTVAPGTHVTLTELEQQIRDMPGFEVDQFVPGQEVPAEGGVWIGRVSALGRSGDVLMVQTLYGVAGPRGEQVLVGFTTESNQTEKLAGRDFSIVKSIEFGNIVQTGIR
ncbi:MAG TPA: hypothetical protein PKC45_16175 [Gemmatales bacterium]|nr:hypothetical protein [Gemmatales bacterium]